jgi:hypothetical protein
MDSERSRISRLAPKDDVADVVCHRGPAVVTETREPELLRLEQLSYRTLRVGSHDEPLPLQQSEKIVHLAAELFLGDVELLDHPRERRGLAMALRQELPEPRAGFVEREGLATTEMKKDSSLFDAAHNDVGVRR